MWIAGVQLSDSSAAHLAALLSRAGHSHPAQRLGIAIDRNVDEIALLPGDSARIIAVLHDPPADLERLREVLGAHVGSVRDDLL